MIDRLRGLLSRLRSRGQGERGPRSVELRPLDQVALAFFHRFGRAAADDLYRELNAAKGASRAETGEVVVRLMGEGLIEARYLPEEGARDVVYHLTRRGERLKGRIPDDPRTVTEFYY